MSFDQLLNQFIGNQQPSVQNAGGNQQQASANGFNIPGGLIGGLAAGGLLGAVVGNKKMRKTATKMAGGMVGIGGAALLGVVAHKAYQNWQHGKADPSANTPSNSAASDLKHNSAELNKFDPAAILSADGQPFELALVKAMVAAAYADGHVDSTEYGKIFEALDKLNMDTSEKAVFLDLLKNPPSIQEIASLANGLEQASEIYLVSRMAIDPDHPSELAYLQDLSRQMGMPNGLVEQLENQVIQQADQAA